MSPWIYGLVIATLLGSALIGGIFFAFSTFIMKALGRVPSAEGIRAMQSINVVVINPMVMGALFGTAILSAAIIALTFLDTGIHESHWFSMGASLYVVGTFFVTALGNVPLNNRLESVSPDSGDQVWQEYLNKWTFWNHIRTVAAMIAALCFIIGLISNQ